MAKKKTVSAEETELAAALKDGSVHDYDSIDYLIDLAPLESHDHKALGLSDEQVLAMYRSMMLQRRFEERAAQAYGRGKIGGFLHLYNGQEAISTGCAAAMRIGQDQLITAYRDHGHGLALGMSPKECMAELYGKIDGSSRGKGGSMHYFKKEVGMCGGHGIVGGQVPVGVGLAFALKYKGTDNVALAFMGDGAAQQGAVHEAANLAGLYKLPAILIVENNIYGMGTAVNRSSAVLELYKRGESYNMHCFLINGMDVLQVYKDMSKAIALARKGEPSFIEIRTYRYRGHSMSDPQKYRTKEEMEHRQNQDPILRLKYYILNNNLADANLLDSIDEEVNQEVLDAVDFAENSPYPAFETMYEDIYVQKDYPFIS
jgi:pyruvate dehydrogenase E1 component alpha subunit